MNSITIENFFDLLINLNSDLKQKLFISLRITSIDDKFLYYLRNLYINIMTNNKTIDFKMNTYTIKDFINFCEILKISIKKIKKIYKNILFNISSISYEDLSRETGYEDKNYDK